MLALVTGGTGFIGRRLVRHLVGRGVRCRLLARPTSDVDVLQGLDVDLVRGDVTRPDTLRDIAQGVDLVYHLAAEGHVTSQSEEAYRRYCSVNVEGTRNLVGACLRAQVRRFVHFSSTAAMGLVAASPIDEESSPNPLTPYQRSKRDAEEVVLNALRTARFPSIVLRPCMVYGPGGAGEFARFCRWFSRGIFPRVGLGPNLTPLVHVDDVVRAAWLAGTKGHSGETYLVAGETSPPLADIRELVLDALHIRRPYPYVPRWLAMVGAWGLELMAKSRGATPLVTRRNIASVTASRVFDITKARQELGYAPLVHLRPGIRETVLWYRDEGLL